MKDDSTQHLFYKDSDFCLFKFINNSHQWRLATSSNAKFLKEKKRKLGLNMPRVAVALKTSLSFIIFPMAMVLIESIMSDGTRT
jgi:hypothetical protein